MAPADAPGPGGRSDGGGSRSGRGDPFPPPAGEVVHNAAVQGGFYPEELRRILSLEAHETAYREISSWPGYDPTPVRRPAGLADAAAVGSVWYKDESGRFGLGSFKSLGGAYAVFRVLEARIRSALESGELPPVEGAGEARRKTGRGRVSGRPRGEHRRPSSGEELVVSSEQLRAGAYGELVSGVTVSCASAGNHGRAVAWGAEQFGCGCVVHVPRGTAGARVAAIEGHGARVERVPDGGYEKALDVAAREARERGRILVPDTAYDGHTDVPRVVMQGYTVLVRETLAQLGSGVRPTHVFVQAGVGGLAAAVTAHLWEALGPGRPRVIVVEAADAACLRQGVREGHRVELDEAPETEMEGLACRAPSRLAWPVLRRGAHEFMAVSDGAAVAAARALAECAGREPELPAGPSGAAGLAGLLSASGHAPSREMLELGPDARVLAVGTEGVVK